MASNFRQILCWNTTFASKIDMFNGSQGSFAKYSYPSCLTDAPTAIPSARPTFRPSSHPSIAPSCHPSFVPSVSPSSKPSLQPTNRPSLAATVWPPKFGTTHTSEIYGNVNSGVKFRAESCPPGYKISSVHVIGSDWIRQLWAICNDGKTTLGPWGETNAVGSLSSSVPCLD